MEWNKSKKSFFVICFLRKCIAQETRQISESIYRAGVKNPRKTEVCKTMYVGTKYTRRKRRKVKRDEKGETKFGKGGTEKVSRQSEIHI